jgi:hypothetical protein
MGPNSNWKQDVAANPAAPQASAVYPIIEVILNIGGAQSFNLIPFI